MTKPRAPWPSSLASPVIWLLVGASVLSAALGELLDAGAIGAMVIVNAVIGFLQEHRAERAVMALRSMTAPRARVMRDGHSVMIAADGIVPGDDLTRLARGRTRTPEGLSVRMVAFGDVDEPEQSTAWTTVSMRHVVQFLQGYLREHWDVLRHAQIRDDAFNVLALIEKVGRHCANPPSRAGRERRPYGRMRVR